MPALRLLRSPAGSPLPGILAAAVITAGAWAAAPRKPAARVQVRVETDRASAVYHCGENAVFRIAVAGPAGPVRSGTVRVTLTLGGGRLLTRRTLPLAPGGARIPATLPEPGFILCRALYRRTTGYGGAAFDPERIRSATPTPSDFDDFWTRGRRRLAAIPPDPRLTPLPKRSDARQASFAVSFANLGGTRIYGFLSVPRGRKPPFPAWVTVPGAGPGFTTPPSRWAARGALALVMNVHAYDTTRLHGAALKRAYAALNRKVRYPFQGAPDPEKYYFRRAILGIDRALQWLTARPDWDRKHLVVDGSSQGGGMALVLAGLNPGKVTAVAANVHALCDPGGYLAGRRPGWPQLVLHAPEKRRPEFLKMAAYFDAVAFARKIRCPAILSAGFIDRTCPAASVYAAYNALAGPKRMFPGVHAGHSWTVGRFRAYHDKWVLGQLGLGSVLPPAVKR